MHQSFESFAASMGLVSTSYICDGRIHRCRTENNHRSMNGAYLYNGIWGFVQDWSKHVDPVYWKSDKIIDDADFKRRVEESKRKYLQERSKLNSDACKKADEIIGQCSLNLSPYLARKGFPESDVLVFTKNDLVYTVVPMRIDKQIVGCQIIDPGGEKRFIYGQKTRDAYHQIGNGKNVFLVEGYASGLSLQSILSALKINYSIIVCFSANNLLLLSKKWSDCFVVADNDKSGTGEKVAKESGKKYYMSPIVGNDINDDHIQLGLFKCMMNFRKWFYER